MKKLFSLSILAILIMSCGISSKYDKLDINTIEFGSGGGFTGVYKTFVLDLKDRTLSKEGEFVRNLSKKELKELYVSVTEGDVFKQKIDKPGNKTYFIHFKGKETNNKLSWGEAGYETSKELKALYDNLTILVKK